MQWSVGVMKEAGNGKEKENYIVNDVGNINSDNNIKGILKVMNQELEEKKNKVSGTKENGKERRNILISQIR